MEKVFIMARRALHRRERPELHDCETKEEKEYATPLPASLEGLPFELKVAVLQLLPGLLCLNSLIQASPVYRAVYFNQMSSILQSVLQPANLWDVLAVHDPRILPAKNKESVKCFLDDYKVFRLSPLSFTSLNLKTLMSIAQTQCLIETVANEYTMSILSPWSKTGEQENFYRPVSQKEKRRLYRVLYRFELFCLLFAPFTKHIEPWQGSTYGVVRSYIFDKAT
jgi:hypothetical protein